ncbi:hypothetical protein [Tsukamurella soli]|uniref:hypothetical protein n=1 Tax=Tsukamurella soli TaxID=644556 RepID=UPI00361C60F6
MRPAKLDFTLTEPELYAAPDSGFVTVVAPARGYLSIAATGSPRTSEDFRRATEALYAAAFGVKVRNKALTRRGVPGADGAVRTDFAVAPLQRVRQALTAHTIDEARWTLLLRLPAWIDDDEVAQSLEEVEVAKGLPAVARVSRVDHPAGRLLQTAVTGSWSRALTPVAKACDVELRERGLTAEPEWYEVCLGEPGAPRGHTYIVGRRVH